MDIIIEEKSNCVILKLNGNLIEGPSSAEFNHIIKRFIDVNQKNIVVDFGDIKFINSTGLSILFRGYLAIENVGGKFKIVNLNSKLKNLLSITKLNTLFDIEENIETAIKSIG
jgi:anti-sigma B factor antagonist